MCGHRAAQPTAPLLGAILPLTPDLHVAQGQCLHPDTCTHRHSAHMSGCKCVHILTRVYTVHPCWAQPPAPSSAPRPLTLVPPDVWDSVMSHVGRDNNPSAPSHHTGCIC